MQRSCRCSLALLAAVATSFASPPEQVKADWVEPHPQVLQAGQAAHAPSAKVSSIREKPLHRISTKHATNPPSNLPKIVPAPVDQVETRPAPAYAVIIKPSLVPRYANAPVVRIDLLRPAREQALAQLSLADINRYQFRRNRPDEPGLPATSPPALSVGQQTPRR